MPDRVVVHGFETSNNMKVRVALGFKQVPYEFRAIDPADRTEIVRISGQHLTPVLVHGDRVLFDSAAILRYLDANFPGPRLFGSTRDEQWAIEDLELYARTALAGPMMEIVHHRVSGGAVDPALRARCSAAFAAAAKKLADALAGREWLVGEQMSAADVTAAPVLHRVRASGLFELPPADESTRGWVRRVMSHDRMLDPASL